jgi:DnaK suppressor protein
MKLEDIRKKLWGQRRMLLQQVARVEDNLRWLGTNVEPEMEEEGQEENMARLLARLDDQETAELEAIDRALARIETGEYGRCTVCGDLISEGRLEALPAAETCLRCAHAREGLKSFAHGKYAGDVRRAAAGVRVPQSDACGSATGTRLMRSLSYGVPRRRMT